MTGLGPSSGGNRPFWLLVALAVTILMSVSTTVAHAAAPDQAMALKRGLTALQAQIEWLDRGGPASLEASPGFNAELGGASLVSQWQTTGRMMRSVRRRIVDLEQGYAARLRHPDRSRASSSSSISWSSICTNCAPRATDVQRARRVPPRSRALAG